MSVCEIRVPTYRRPRLLERALRSVLAQSHRDWRCIVLDDCPDGSAETTIAAVHDGRIRYRRNTPALGAIGNIDQAFRNRPLAGGEWAMVLEDDNYLLPGHLAAQLETCRTQSVAVVLAAQAVEAIDVPGEPGHLLDSKTLACSARAYRIIGQLEDAAGASAAEVKTWMAQAARLSIRESGAVYWMMRQSMDENDHAKVFYYADALLRTRGGVMGLVVPALVWLRETPTGDAILKTALKSNPPWRREFFAAVPEAAGDARIPLDLLLSLKGSAAPPTPAEVNGFLQLLVNRHLEEFAYYAWLQFLSPEQLASTGFLYNGSFEVKPSGAPFDWVIRQGPGTSVEVLPKPDARTVHALSVNFNIGRVEFGGVSQTTMLAPGDYVLSGKVLGEITGRRGLRWRVFCGSGKRLGEGPMALGLVPRWTQFSLEFKVPDEDCRSQVVRLELDARSASEQLVNGTMWYDELAISRVAPAAAAPRY